MRSKILLLSSALLLVAVVRALGLPAAPPPASVELGEPSFKERFKKAMADKKPPEMARLVKDDERNAELWIIRACEVLADRDDPDETAFFTAIADAWKTSFKTEFPTRYRDWFKGLTKEKRKERKELLDRWDKVHRDFFANKQAKDGFAFLQIVEEVEQLGPYFEQVGDEWYSSEAWLVDAACFDEALRGDSADFAKAAKGLDAAIAAREQIDCKDGAHAEAVKRKAELAKKADSPADSGKGADPAKGGGQAGGETPSTPTELGPPLKTPLAFEPLPSFDAYTRPSYFADEIFVIWNPVKVLGNGTSGTFAYTEGLEERVLGAPKIVRTGAADLRVDVDADGKGDEKIPLTNTGAPIRMSIGKGDAARPWAFFAFLGGQQETYQGVTTNFDATKEQMTIYVLSAASVVGNLAGTQIRVIDDSMDGNYGVLDKEREPRTYGYIGLTQGVYHPELDSVVIGTSKHARPWSETFDIGGKWYRLEGGYAGKELVAAPVAPDTGTLVLDFKGPTPPAWAIVRGTGPLAACFYDLVEGGSKGVVVPAGRYQLYYGEVRKGKKKQVQKTLILPGKSPVNYDVKKGGTTVVTLGAPFKFDYKVEKPEDGKFTVKGESVCVVGSAGERYERSWSCVPKPEIVWRKKGQKSPSKPTRMGVVMDTAMLEKHGWPASWFPLDTTVETKEKPGSEVEVQLVDKKNDLFGKVESDWKE